MSLRARSGETRVGAAAPVRPNALVGSLWPLLLVCVIAGGVAGFFLVLYLRKAEPIGWDTARYLDQANLIRAHGISGAANLHVPRPSALFASRVGFPTSVLTLSALFHSSTFKLAAVVPIAAVTAAALASAAFVTYSLQWGPWEFAAVAAVVGTSTAMSRLMAGTYTDNLIATAAFAAALIPILIAVREGRRFVAAILLLVAGGLAHPSFYAFMLAVLGVVLLVYVPESWVAWRRRGRSFFSTPAARLGLVMVGSGGASAVMLGVLGASPDTPALNRPMFVQKLREDIPLYRFPITIPLAVVGIASLGARLRRRPRRGMDGDGQDPVRAGRGSSGQFNVRFLLILVLAWGAVTAAGIAAFVLGKSLPAHRFLAFLLPLPVMVALGILTIARFVGGRTGPVITAAIAGIGVVAMGFLGHLEYRALDRRHLEYVEAAKIKDTVAAVKYLRAMRVPTDAPVVFLITDTGPQPQLSIPEFAHVLRAALPAARVPHSYFYVGSPDNFLAGRPTVIQGGFAPRGYNVVSNRFWASVQPIIASHPVALVLMAYNPPSYEFVADQHPDWIVAPDVAVVQGSRPSRLLPAVRAYPTAPRGVLAIFLFGAGTLAVLALIGLGWVIGLMPGDLRPFEALALSVAFGLALLVMGGTIADAVGIRLSGLGGASVGPVVGALGWVLGGRTLLQRPPGTAPA